MKGLLKNIVGAVAPTLGSAMGGPLGNMAMGKIAEVLGVSNDQKSIQQAMQSATPEQMLELKKAEQEFEVQMKELDVEQNSEALINLVLGYLGGLASAIISFYFGASHTNDKGE